jgi:lipopolysaccharide transport system permease protein
LSADTLSRKARPPGSEPAAAVAYRVRIQPSSGWLALDLGELWAARDLLFVLAARDVRLRYKQTVLGIAWVVLQPLVAALIFAVIFGRFANLPSDGTPYLLFVYAGLLPWNLFAGAVQRAGSSLVSESSMISKVYFPRMAIPIASTFAVLLDFLIALAVFGVLMLVFRVTPGWNLLFLPLAVLLVFLFTIGMSLWLSALNVYYRDFVHALPFVMQVWLYTSPVVYAASLVPEQWRGLYSLNPMVGVIEAFRWTLIGGSPFPWLSVGLATAIVVVTLVVGALVFRRVERAFADVV